MKSWALALMVRSGAWGVSEPDALPTPGGLQGAKRWPFQAKSNATRASRTSMRSLRRSSRASTSAGRWRARARFSAVTSSTEPG